MSFFIFRRRWQQRPHIPLTVMFHRACPGPVIRLASAQRPDDSGAAYPARVKFVVCPHHSANLKAR